MKKNFMPHFSPLQLILRKPRIQQPPIQSHSQSLNQLTIKKPLNQQTKTQQTDSSYELPQALSKNVLTLSYETATSQSSIGDHNFNQRPEPRKRGRPRRQQTKLQPQWLIPITKNTYVTLRNLKEPYRSFYWNMQAKHHFITQKNILQPTKRQKTETQNKISTQPKKEIQDKDFIVQQNNQQENSAGHISNTIEAAQNSCNEWIFSGQVVNGEKRVSQEKQYANKITADECLNLLWKKAQKHIQSDKQLMLSVLSKAISLHPNNRNLITIWNSFYTNSQQIPQQLQSYINRLSVQKDTQIFESSIVKIQKRDEICIVFLQQCYPTLLIEERQLISVLGEYSYEQKLNYPIIQNNQNMIVCHKCMLSIKSNENCFKCSTIYHFRNAALNQHNYTFMHCPLQYAQKLGNSINLQNGLHNYNGPMYYYKLHFNKVARVYQCNRYLCEQCRTKQNKYYCGVCLGNCTCLRCINMDNTLRIIAKCLQFNMGILDDLVFNDELYYKVQYLRKGFKRSQRQLKNIERIIMKMTELKRRIFTEELYGEKEITKEIQGQRRAKNPQKAQSQFDNAQKRKQEKSRQSKQYSNAEGADQINGMNIMAQTIQQKGQEIKETSQNIGKSKEVIVTVKERITERVGYSEEQLQKQDENISQEHNFVEQESRKQQSHTIVDTKIAMKLKLIQSKCFEIAIMTKDEHIRFSQAIKVTETISELKLPYENRSLQDLPQADQFVDIFEVPQCGELQKEQQEDSQTQSTHLQTYDHTNRQVQALLCQSYRQCMKNYFSNSNYSPVNHPSSYSSSSHRSVSMSLALRFRHNRSQFPYKIYIIKQ